jgi:hypothetical protein
MKKLTNVGFYQYKRLQTLPSSGRKSPARHYFPSRPVTGPTSSQQFSVALSLAEELLGLKESHSLTALRSLDKFLSYRMELLTNDVMALPPPQRASHIIGYVKTMKDGRPSGGASSSDGAASSSSSGG